MFLPNSRTPLVTETYKLFICRHPLYLRYGARLPNSLNRVILERLGFLSQGHYSWFSVRSHPILGVFLFTGPRPLPDISTVPSFNLLLTITVLQRFMLVRRADKLAGHSPSRRKIPYRCRKRMDEVQECEPVSPSCITVLRVHLGPTNP